MTTFPDIFGANPGWLIRRGMILLFGLVILLFGLAWLIRYPDVHRIPAHIEGATAPLQLTAAKDARLLRLFKIDGDTVEAGTTLAIFEHTGNWKHIQNLQQALEAGDQPPPDLQLGNLQGAYATWQTLQARWQAEQIQNTPQILQKRTEQKAMLEAQIAPLDQQLQLAREEAMLGLEALQRDSVLYTQGAVSLIELTYTKRELLRVQQLEKELEARNFELRREIRAVEEGSLQLEGERNRAVSNAGSALDAALQQLLSALEAWEREHLLQAPQSGRIQWNSALQPGQYLRAGNDLGVLLPASSNQVLVVGMLPASSRGRVATGQRAYFRFDAYPYQQYGQLEGRVLRVSDHPENGLFPVRVALHTPLQTSYGQTLHFQPGWTGELRILSEDRRLLTRLFDVFRSTVLD